jgi:hypothetical protein
MISVLPIVDSFALNVGLGRQNESHAKAPRGKKQVAQDDDRGTFKKMLSAARKSPTGKIS